MSVILQPASAFPLVRQIGNHTDATTYYVRAVIRNAAGDIIDTVNLASQGNQRYQTSWRVPADTSGQGAYISVVTSVYTDSGYTSKSENYGDEETTFLIFDRVMPAMRGGSGGGIDSRTLRRVISEELAKLPTPEKPERVELPEMRFDEALSAIGEATKAIRSLPQERTDLSGVLKALDALAAKIDAQKSIGEGFADLATIYQSAEREMLAKVEETIQGAMDSLELTIAPTVTSVAKKPKEEEEPVPFDLNKLAI